MIVSPAWHAGDRVEVASNNSPFWGYGFQPNTYDDDCAIYLWWPIPEDCKRSQPVALEFNHFLAGSTPGGDRRYKIKYSSKPYTAQHGSDWDPAAAQSDSVQQDVSASDSIYTEVGEVKWQLAPAVAFPQGAVAVAFKIEREAPSSGTDANQTVGVGRITLSYSLQHHHVHE